MTILEKDIEAKLVCEARSHGFLTYKLDQIPGQRHMPDQLLINPHRECVFVEVKRLDEKARKAQKAMHRQLREAGQHVFVIDKVADIETIIEIYK